MAGPGLTIAQRRGDIEFSIVWCLLRGQFNDKTAEPLEVIVVQYRAMRERCNFQVRAAITCFSVIMPSVMRDA